MKKFFAALIVCLAVNLSYCNAAPTYDTGEDITRNGYHRYSAWVTDYFYQYDRVIGIRIEKYTLIKDYSDIDSYLYAIEIYQRIDENPFSIKSVVIMSETDGVEFFVNNPGRTKGLDFVTDRILIYPDKVSSVIKSVWSKMLIRITTTSGAVYDYYPSSQYITYAKKVADWASR